MGPALEHPKMSPVHLDDREKMDPQNFTPFQSFSQPESGQPENFPARWNPAGGGVFCTLSLFSSWPRTAEDSSRGHRSSRTSVSAVNEQGCDAGQPGNEAGRVTDSIAW